MRLSPLPSAAALRAADAEMAEAGLPALALMENAGRAAGQWLLKHAPPGAVLVACGKGGNGGDGFVVARVLAEAGRDVDVWALPPVDQLRDDARQHRLLLERLAPHLPGRVRFVDDADPGAHYAAAIDALLGTGQTGSLRPPEAATLDVLAGVPWRAALDVPTGLDADTGVAADGAVLAHATLAFAAASPGLYLNDGPTHAGQVAVLDIGIPGPLLEAQITAHGGSYRTHDGWAASVQPVRGAHAHKYTAGAVLVVAGSEAYPGAPRLAATAAARAGAGYVRLATAAPAAAVVAPSLPDIPTTALPLHADGGLDPARALPLLQDALGRTDALVVGPGLGRAASTGEAVRALLLAFDGPAVVDADALAAVTPDFLAAHAAGRWVLTPHAGELARLVGEDHLDLIDRVAVARALARRWNVVLVVKGLPSIVAEPSGRVALSAPHTPALATAGTGDVLAGLTGGFLAQGLAPFDAALLALHTGGRAALRYTRRHAAASMQASDLLRLVPLVLAR